MIQITLFGSHSPTDAGLVVTGGGHDVGFIWRVGEGTDPKESKGHTDSIAALVISSDGLLLASGDLMDLS